MNEREPTVNWFFVHDGKPDGAGYFVGYERTSNRRVGFIGMSGFRTGPVPAADWIPVRRRTEELGAGLDLFGPRVGAPTRPLGMCRRAWFICHPETNCDRSTSPRGR